jgi:hypothetical protein
VPREADLQTRGALHIQEIGEDPLSSLGPQVGYTLVIGDSADRRAEHQIELSGRSEDPHGAGDWRWKEREDLSWDMRQIQKVWLQEWLCDVQLLGEGLGSLHRPFWCDRTHSSPGSLSFHETDVAHVLFRDSLHLRPEGVVSANPDLRLFAVQEWVRETINMARGFPNQRRGDDRCVESHDIAPLVDILLPPIPFEIIFELHSEMAIVKETRYGVVDLRGGINEAPSLTKTYNIVHLRRVTNK